MVASNAIITAVVMTMLQQKRSNSSELEATIVTSNYYTHGSFNNYSGSDDYTATGTYSNISELEVGYYYILCTWL